MTVLGIADHDTIAGLERARRRCQHATATSKSSPLSNFQPIGKSARFSARLHGGLSRSRHHRARRQIPRRTVGARARKSSQNSTHSACPSNLKRSSPRSRGDAAIGRPHVARALVEAGHVATVQEAFDKYLASDKPAYVEYESASPYASRRNDSCGRCGPVLAHPQDVERLSPNWYKSGLVGLECYYVQYNDHDQHATRRPGQTVRADRKPAAVTFTDSTAWVT